MATLNDNPNQAEWWPLHLRVARGETLSEQEQAIYKAALERLDAEERRDTAATAAPQQAHLRMHVRINALKAERDQLQAQHEALATRIRELEARLNETTPQTAGASS